MEQDIFTRVSMRGQRLTQKQKNADNYKWYHEQTDLLDSHSVADSSFKSFGGQVTEYKRKKTNYDLFNNQVNLKDLEYVCKPFGAEGGELPANMVNRDIVSPKIKVLLGMEMKMPFSWKVIAVNEEATTRKEKEQFDRIKQFVYNEVMMPIKQQLEQQQAEQNKGRQLTLEEQQQLQQQLQEELKTQTPEEVKKYMTREHQDPAEVLMHQILEYLIPEQRVAEKFNKGFKHSLLGGHDLYHVGIFNGKPTLTVVNNLNFNCDESSDLEGVEDGQWATCEYRFTPDEAISKFGSQLTEEQIDRIYSFERGSGSSIADPQFTFNADRPSDAYTIRALHCTWKSLMKIGFLIYNSAETGKEEMMIVDENYKLNKTYGDISIQWEWIPETHECWKLMTDIYVYCRPVPGQHKDVNNLWEAKLPYYGAACDSMNSIVTSAMDRIKYYQYLYNIVIYRIELLMASDKGKKLMFNIDAIPKSAGIDTKKWIYFFEANSIGWFSNKEEGTRGQGGVGDIAKEIDMTMANNIQSYISIAEYIDTKCGTAIGVTKPMEGQISPTDAVTNTKQNIVQASHIVQPYFELHNIVKGKTLKALVETAKIAYSDNPPGVLSYVMDDMTVKMLQVDQGLLDSSSYGLFISNSGKAQDAKDAILNLAQAAMQNQQIDMLDVVKIIKSDDMNEAEELLTVSMQNKQEQAQAADKAKLQQEKELEDKQREHEKEGWKHEEDMITLKARLDKDTKMAVAAVTALGFNKDKDVDGDGTPDVLELAKLHIDTTIKDRKQTLDENKFEHQKEVDKESLKNESKKIQIQKNKTNKT